MENEQKENKLKIGSGLFYLIWILIIILISTVLLAGVYAESKELNFILFLILIGIIFLPFLKSFNVGKIFGMELQNLSSTVEKLRETIVNLNLTNKQEFNVINVKGPDDQNLQTSTPTPNQSQKNLNIGESLIGQGRYLEAIRVFEDTLKIDQDNWIAAMYAGYSYLSLPDIGVDPLKWCFDNEERLMKSIYYSTYATTLDPNHYNQFMNLAIAQKHLGGEGLIKLAIKNMNIAYDMLEYDPSVRKNPILFMNKGKARSFMGEFAEAISQIEDAKKYRREAIEIFNKCPEPKPQELEKWKKDAEDGLRKLEEGQ